MANWCSNTVVFEGKPETITVIQELFQSIKEKEEKTEEGQLPEFISKDNGVISSISIGMMAMKDNFSMKQNGRPIWKSFKR